MMIFISQNPGLWSFYLRLQNCAMLAHFISLTCFPFHVGVSRAAPPVDGLLFLQHRAGNTKLRNGGVLVSSQAGQLCLWSTAGQKRTYGKKKGTDRGRTWAQRVSQMELHAGEEF